MGNKLTRVPGSGDSKIDRAVDELRRRVDRLLAKLFSQVSEAAEAINTESGLERIAAYDQEEGNKTGLPSTTTTMLSVDIDKKSRDTSLKISYVDYYAMSAAGTIATHYVRRDSTNLKSYLFIGMGFTSVPYGTSSLKNRLTYIYDTRDTGSININVAVNPGAQTLTSYERSLVVEEI